MRKSFYPKMAWSGISHNRKLYIPYFFTCIAMVMMFYIRFLKEKEQIR